MYTLGSVALLAGLGSGCAGWAVAAGGFVRPWVRGAGVSRVFAPALPGFTFCRRFVWAYRDGRCRAHGGFLLVRGGLVRRLTGRAPGWLV